MSGGFYGVSSSLAKKMLDFPGLAHFNKGPEDLQIGHLIEAVLKKEPLGRREINIMNWPNGEHWCHFKNRTDMTFEHLSGQQPFVSDDCFKRR
jgi:hypothetical protein